MAGIFGTLIFFWIVIHFSVAAKSITLKEFANAERKLANTHPDHGKCEDITVPMCSGIVYNTTIFPNFLHQPSQERAALELDQFATFVKLGCSPLQR